MRVHEGALNDAINYAQKGCDLQMWGITFKQEIYSTEQVHGSEECDNPA